MSQVNYPRIPPSGIGESAKHNFSPWFIKLRFDDKSPIEGRKWVEATKPLSILQSRIGNEFEEQVYEKLEPMSEKHISSWFDWGDNRNEEQIISAIKSGLNGDYDKPIMLTQARMMGEIGIFEISGDADLILIFSTEYGVHIHVLDIKSSWEEKPSQQLQTATYTLILKQILSDTDFDFTVGAGIIYRETNLNEVMDYSTNPSFHLKTREGDLKRVLKKDGPFDRAFKTDFGDLPLTIENNSPYSEVNIVEAIESSDLSILGLSPSEKENLRQYGIENLEDIADLYEFVSNPKPYEYTEPKVNEKYKSVVSDIKENCSLSMQLSILCQKAQSLLGEFNPDYKKAHDKPWSPWLQGVGPAKLPEDNPPYDTDLNIKESSLIRVYLNIQYDHVRDSLLTISGRVDCGLYDNHPLTFSRTVENISKDPKKWQGKYEAKLLRESIQDIYNILSIVSDLTNQSNKAPIHFYIYGQDEYEAIYDSIIRHKDKFDIIDSFRKLMDSREGINQSMFSILETEIESKFALKTLDSSIVTISERMYPNDGNAKMSNEDWNVKLDTGVEVNLKKAFKEQMFDSYVPIKQGRKPQILTKFDNSFNSDNYYPTTSRSGSQIPCEYAWAASDFGLLDKSWTEDEQQQKLIEKFSWVDSNTKDIPITSELFELLSVRLAHCLHRIERSITFRDIKFKKNPINMQELLESGSEIGSFSESCREYLDLESQQQMEEAFKVYKKPLEERIISGDSVPIEITEVLADEGYMFRAKGELLFDKFGFENPQEIAGSSRIGGSDETTGGTRCVATELKEDKNGNYVPEHRNPSQIARQLKISVDTYRPEKSEIIIEGYRRSRHAENEYVLNRPSWTLENKNSRQFYVGEGSKFILDPNPDNSMADKSIKAIRQSENNPVYNDILSMRKGDYSTKESMFDKNNIESYFTFAKDALEFLPNEKQKEFICETNRYSLLQGPPGTGKTSGAIAQSLLARSFAGEQTSDRIVSLVTGLSNKSVDEVMHDVAKLLELFDKEFDKHVLENMRLVRLSYNEPKNHSDKIEYLNYQDDTDISIIRNLILDMSDSHQETLKSSSNEGQEHVIVFATPGKVDGLIKKLFPSLSAEQGYENAYNFFDVLAIDEASMMPIYQLLMTSAFIKDNSQIMIAGDQRQLSPVQQYEWKNERKESITYHLPHLSVLDYFRYLRGEDVEQVPDEAPESPEIKIPITRLNKTYRCHKVVTEFIKQTIYEKDGINYNSDQSELMNPVILDTTKGLETALDADYPITIMLHDDRVSRQVNMVESLLIKEMTKIIPDSETVGVVTPHNAQKGKLNYLCERGDIDTVERFQGGEKDVMFLSTTVSDPNHISSEEDFLFSENRLNVALSRMRKKLIVLLPQSVLEQVPKDIDTYDQARIWKALYSISAADSNPDWNGKVSDLLPRKNYILNDTNVKIYNVDSI